MAIINTFISLKEAAAISGYHSDYIGSLVRSGKINGKKEGKNWYVSKDDVLNHFMSKHYVPAWKVFLRSKMLVFLSALCLIILCAAGVYLYSTINTGVGTTRAYANSARTVKNSLNDGVRLFSNDAEIVPNQ